MCAKQRRSTIPVYKVALDRRHPGRCTLPYRRAVLLDCSTRAAAMVVLSHTPAAPTAARASRRGVVCAATRRPAHAAQHQPQQQVGSRICGFDCGAGLPCLNPLAALASACTQGLEGRPQQAGAAPLSSGANLGAAAGLDSAPAAATAGPPPPTAPLKRLQLHYRSLWEQPVLHHSISGGEWRGVPMQPVSQACAGCWTCSPPVLPCRR